MYVGCHWPTTTLLLYLVLGQTMHSTVGILLALHRPTLLVSPFGFLCQATWYIYQTLTSSTHLCMLQVRMYASSTHVTRTTQATCTLSTHLKHASQAYTICIHLKHTPYAIIL